MEQDVQLKKVKKTSMTKDKTNPYFRHLAGLNPAGKAQHSTLFRFQCVVNTKMDGNLPSTDA